MAESSLLDRVARSELPVFVEVWAPWCLPCRRMEPEIKRLEQVYEGQVEVWRLNADQEPDLVRALHVMAVPTLVLFRSGQEIARRVGGQGRSELDDLFASASRGLPLPPPGVRRVDRLIRLAAGSALLLLAAISGPSWLLAGVGAVVLFTAVYDRCPAWRALTARWRESRPNQAPSDGQITQASQPAVEAGERG